MSELVQLIYVHNQPFRGLFLSSIVINELNTSETWNDEVIVWLPTKCEKPWLLIEK